MEYLSVGKIVRTIGLKGEVKVFPITHFRDSRFKKGSHVFLLDNNNNVLRDLTIKIHKKNGECDNLIFEEISSMKADAKWFLDGHYSDEFEQLIKNLKDRDLDELVKEYLPIVFDETEKQSWIKRIVLSAYIKFGANKISDAQKLYSLAQNEYLLEEFFVNLLQRSIYEYFLIIKYNKDLNSENISHDEIEEKIKYIEKNWTKSNV